VHKATIIYQGEKIDVACKILYPFISELVAIDLKSIKAIFRLVKFFLPHFRSESIYPQIVKIIKAEINLENEARNLEKIKENFQNEAEYVFPEVFHDLSNRRILTLRFITGIKITNIDELRKNQIEPKQIASLLIQAYAKQIFQHRFFHADPHPGNLLVLPGPKLAFLDFGACGEMKAFRRDALRKIIRSAMARDYFKVIEGLKELGAVPKTADMKILETAVAYAIEKISKMEREVTDITTLSFEELSGLEDLRYLNQFNIGLRDLMSAFDVPEGWVAVERVIAHVMAIIMEIAPESTLGSLAKPFLSKILLDDFNDLKTFIGQRGKIAAYNFFDLPQSFSNVLNQFSRGRIEMGIHGFDTTFQELVRVQKQVIISLFTGIFSFLAIYCYQSDMEYLFVNFALSAIFCLLSVGRNAFKKSPLSKGWSQSEGHYIHGFKLKSDDEI
jgi:predicted unusual protein kinase regulating ubiquinone biosynthesis (AarF/ABC1/UbiB family)